MNENDIYIRVANLSDAEVLRNIYAPYVEETAITFEYEVPTIEEFTRRVKKVLERYPYLVAVSENEIVGYAYASPLKERKAYDWAVELSIYVKQDCRGKGVGRKLYNKLEETLKQQNILNLYACIAYPGEENTHLTDDSVKFHEHMGYKIIGQFSKCGYKFQQWYDMIWMEKHIGEHMKEQKEVRTFSQIYNRNLVQ